MKKTNSIINGIGVLTLMGILRAHGDCFNYSSGPTQGSPVTSQVSVVSSCEIDGCPYAGATPGTCSVSSTVSGQTMTEYSGSASAGISFNGATSASPVAGQPKQ
jgi:hypothetical protein